MLSSLGHFIKDTIFPPICAVCGSLCQDSVCKSCLSNIKFLGANICQRCGTPASAGDIFQTGNYGTKDQQKISCSLCRLEDFSFYMARSFAIYSKEIACIIHKYKYRQLYFLSDILLYFLMTAYEYYYSGQKIELIETVPAIYKNTFTGGSLPETETENDSGHMRLLAAKLSSCLKIPFGDDIIKIKKTSRQQGLGRTQRKLNIRNSFKVKNCIKVNGKNILLLDDVWTTGSTLNEISRQLKNAGAEKIYVLTVARGAL
ncbi:MAG: ComF family protein [Actinobacteria bacterium]|nr:ComF family protein [Actinomycetota bacterium]